jgi:BirA family biotin operon repressor/biotin-[acetyl-CoA-carboxylase] ligase
VRLSDEARDAGYRLLTLDATDSTNNDAVAAARDGEPGKLWIVASEQLAGRGRQGRQWSSPPGNLYASLLLIDPCPPAIAPQLGFVAGLALHEAAETSTGQGAPRLALKWPNDLLLDGAKVSGLLLEAHRMNNGALAVVAGFGVNVENAPFGTPYPTATLRQLRPALTREKMFAALSASVAHILEAWQARVRSSADAFSPIRRLWLERAAGLGQPVTLRLPSGDRSGTFEGLDSVGRLQLRAASAIETIDAGDLFFPHLTKTAAPDAGATGS